MKKIKFSLNISFLAILIFSSSFTIKRYKNNIIDVFLINRVHDFPAKIEKVNVLNYRKQNDTTSKFYKDYLQSCEKWRLNKKEIEYIFFNSKKISGQEFQYDYSILPCSYTGKVIITFNHNHI